MRIPKIASIRDYNLFVLRQLNRYADTSHVLSIQTDGYILNPENWNKDWLQYDYIRAPWVKQPWNKNNRVGNSGFCLRSKRLLDATAGWTEQQYENYLRARRLLAGRHPYMLHGIRGLNPSRTAVCTAYSRGSILFRSINSGSTDQSGFCFWIS